MTKVTGSIVKTARDNTEHHRSQIQGFYYKTTGAKMHTHAIRDLTKRGKGKVWSTTMYEWDYDVSHDLMMDQIEIIRDEILAAEITRLLGVQVDA